MFNQGVNKCYSVRIKSYNFITPSIYNNNFISLPCIFFKCSQINRSGDSLLNLPIIVTAVLF